MPLASDATLITLRSAPFVLTLSRAIFSASLEYFEPSTGTNIFILSLLDLFLDLRLFHREPYSLKDEKDREAPPHCIDDIEDQQEGHQTDLVFYLYRIYPVIVICSLHGLFRNL